MFTDRNRKYYIIVILLCLALLYMPAYAGTEAEKPIRVFDGREDAAAVLLNLDFADVKHTDTWAKNAIWETGALGLMKSYGGKHFGLLEQVSVEEAIAIVYNMAGREAEAQLAAEALDLSRRQQDRKTIAPRMWSDGYIQLAFNDGLITQKEYEDAFRSNQASLSSSDFRRRSPVTREDMAFYIAKILQINPVNAQTHLYNQYNDWHLSNPHRIPYIESLLQNKIMNGNNGFFYPKGFVTREQAAQIIMNAEPFLLTRLNMEKLRGTITGISRYTDRTDGELISVAQVNVRSSSGELHQFRFSRPVSETGANEITGDINMPFIKGTIVNENGVLKDETALREGQEIIYFVKNNRLQYVTILDNQIKTEYQLAKILSVDEEMGEVQYEALLLLPFSDIRLLNLKAIYNASPTGIIDTLTVSNGASITIDLMEKTLKDVKSEFLMLMTIENGLITAMEKINPDLLREEGIVSGILEENNTVLGYVTLYFPDGSGTSPELSRHLSIYRTYSYLHPQNVVVYKNGISAAIDDLQPGDSVFIKLDEQHNIVMISGVDNYYPVYGRVRTKGNWTLLLEKEDGTVEQLRIPADTQIFRDKRSVTWNELKEGDNIRILLQKTGNQVVIGEIVIEKNNAETAEISGVYKAQLVSVDSTNKDLVVSELRQFSNGIWLLPEIRGINKIQLNDKYLTDIPKGAHGTVYFATGKNLLGNDTVIRLSIDNESLFTEVISDTIADVQPGHMTLVNRNLPVQFDDSSLIIKGGRLLNPNQVKTQDEGYVVAGNLLDGSLKANIVWLQEQAADTGLTLYRGRISQITAQTSMTLQSFSQFKSPDWEFVNTPKTLTLDPALTRVLDDDGITDLAVFDDTGNNSFKNRTVYVLAQDGKAVLISTAPYGDVVYRGQIARLTGASKDPFGHIITPASSFTMSEAFEFNRQTWLWDKKPGTEMFVPVNAVIIKNGKMADAGMLKEGDKVTIIKAETGDNAFVIMAESY